MLNPRQQDEFRIKIARFCRMPSSGIIVHQNGNFEMHNVSDDDSRNIVYRLHNCDFIDYVSRTPSRYDFGHYTMMGLPKQLYTINGNIDTSLI